MGHTAPKGSAVFSLSNAAVLDDVPVRIDGTSIAGAFRTLLVFLRGTRLFGFPYAILVVGMFAVGLPQKVIVYKMRITPRATSTSGRGEEMFKSIQLTNTSTFMRERRSIGPV